MTTYRSALLSSLTAILVLPGCGGGSVDTGGGGSGTANLVIASADIDTSPGLPVKGTAVTVTATITNSGGEDSAATTYSYTFDGNVVSAALAAIPAGESTTVSFDVTSAVAGALPVKVALDPAGKVDESNDGDNSATVTVTWTETNERNVILGAPVLTEGAAASDGTATSAQTIGLSFTLTLVEPDLIGSRQVRWSLVRIFGEDEVELASPIASVGTGSSLTVTPSALAWPGVAGTYTYILTADPGDLLAESIESDNVRTFTIVWTSGS